MKGHRGNWPLFGFVAALALFLAVAGMEAWRAGRSNTTATGRSPSAAATGVAVSSPTPNWTPTVTPAPATRPSATTTLKPQTYPGTLVITRISEPDHNYDIYLIRSDGTGLRRLTSGRGNQENAYWSPDGRHIFYSASFGTWVMHADGSGKAPLRVSGSPSPDGKHILNWDDGLWVMNTDGSDRRCVVGLSGGTNGGLIEERFEPQYATWTPNGAIVFVRVPSEGWGEPYPAGDLLAVNPDGSGFVWLTKGAGMILPSVSPDGRTVAAYVPKEDRIVTVPWQAGAAPVTLLADASHHFRNGGMPIAQWTSDARKLVLGSSNLGEYRGSVLFLVNADGSGLTRVPHVKDAVCPDWRPQ